MHEEGFEGGGAGSDEGEADFDCRDTEDDCVGRVCGDMAEELIEEDETNHARDDGTVRGENVLVGDDLEVLS